MEQQSEKEVKAEKKGLGKAELICLLCFALLFYFSCYLMFPHGDKLLFIVVFCLGGFGIPFAPLMIADKYKSSRLAVIGFGVLSIPIILVIVYFVKLGIIAEHNYVIQGADTMKFNVEADWELIENSGVGDDWKKRVKVQTDLDDPDKDSNLHLASIGSDITVTVTVREDDSYDDDEDRGYDLDFDESAHNQVIFPVSANFGNEQQANVGVTLQALNQNKDGTGDNGEAKWKCIITIKRVFDFWEIVTASLDYDGINYNDSYVLGTIGSEPESARDIVADDGSIQYIPLGFYDYIYNTYENETLFAVDSSAISEIGYSKEYEYLLIRFKDSGSLYVYVDVPEEVFKELNNADSPGQYFNNKIRDYYGYAQLE